MADVSQNWLSELHVLQAFTEYSGKFTASQVAKKITLPQRTVARYLQRLTDMGFIQYVREGRQKYYYFDLHASVSREVLFLLESYKALRFLRDHPNLRSFLGQVSEQRTVVLFGSYARGNQRGVSDLDVCIVGKKSGAVQKLLSRAPLEIHPQWTTLLRFERLLRQRHPLAAEIAKDHILFGEKEKIIEILVQHWR